jgi:DNA-binding CsgD family transcriptional regulator
VERNNWHVQLLSGVELVGRERELETGRRFLAAVAGGGSALVVTGDAGIGKTVVWRQLADEARTSGYRVLAARCFGSDVPLGFATLADLLDDVLDEVGDELPAAQRSALGFALRRSEPEGGAPDALTVSRGVLGVLRLLAAATPVVLALDDVQWIDSPSARVLTFALRRLEGEPVGALATQRRGEDGRDGLLLQTALPEGRVNSVELGPLSVGALHHLVRARLGISLPRADLVRLHEASGGNPMFALEFARALPESAPAAVLPMPPSLHELVRDRLAALPADLRPLLEVVAVLGHPRLGLLGRVYAGAIAEPLDAAVAAGAVVEEDGRVRFAHPLLASAVYAEASSARRQELHRAAAAVLDDVEERVRHLALAATGPDEETAVLLDRAAERASGRGAPDAAAEFAEWAQRLTPAEHRAERDRRVIRAAGYLIEAGDEDGARRLLDPLLATNLPDPLRAEALLVRASAEWNDRGRLLELLEQALACARDDPRLRCEALILYTWQGGHLAGDDYAAERCAREALELAERVGEPGLREQAAVLAMEIGSLRAQPVPALPREPLDAALHSVRRPSWGMISRGAVLGRQLMFRGRLDEARALLGEELERASRQGSELRLAVLCQVVTELELRAGNWKLARTNAEEGFRIMREVGGNGEMIVRLGRGRVAAHQGRVVDALDDLGAALARAESQRDVVNTIRSRGSLGFLHLSLGDHARAWTFFEGLLELIERMGAHEPGANVLLLPDAVETLVMLGRLDEAEGHIARLEQRARALEHAWATPAGERCRGLLLLGRSQLESAIETLESSQAGFERIGFPFDRARSLLALGDTLRRAGRRRLAAEKLQAARMLFEQLGAPLWLERTETELRRAAPRPRREGELTAAEARVARLVSAGATNKEVAAQLFTTVATVEAHLTRIYRKLDLRSRNELTRKVADGSLRLPDTS